MKRTIIGTVFLITLVDWSSVFSQQYYPLTVGNRWDYVRSYAPDPLGPPTRTDTFSVAVKQTTNLLDGKTYFELERPDIVGGRFVRADSSALYYYDERVSKEILVYKLDAAQGDWWEVSGPTSFAAGAVHVVHIDTLTLFGNTVRVMRYLHNSLVSHLISISDKFGPISYGDDGEPGGTSRTQIRLLGCILSNIAYGNPIVSVENSASSPSVFHLSQNYPNPFNASTTIEFSLPQSSSVTLTITNVLGEEIRLLQSVVLGPGMHKVIWDAGEYPSGVYFYQIVSGQYFGTKKLLLLK